MHKETMKHQHEAKLVLGQYRKYAFFSLDHMREPRSRKICKREESFDPNDGMNSLTFTRSVTGLLPSSGPSRAYCFETIQRNSPSGHI